MYKLITVIILLASLHCLAQTPTDKTKIYRTVIEKFSDKNLPIVNEAFVRIYKYDIDGNFDRWLNPGPVQSITDSSEVVVSAICASPVRYSQSVAAFLQANNILPDFSGFPKEANEVKPENLSNYLPDNTFISWKKAPLSNSFLGNLFKKRNVTALSSIYFDRFNRIALVKIQSVSKGKIRSKNLSRIIILQKTGTEWKAIGSLDESTAAG